MNALTVEEARTLVQFHLHKTIAKTAVSMKKGGSAIVYTLESIEEKCNLKLFDRTGYRTVFLPAGERVLEGCRKLLQASEDLGGICDELALGWEADLQVVAEGVVPVEPLIRGIKAISEKKSPTRFHVQVEFMGEVEETFLKTGANIMISVLPPEKTVLTSVPLFEVPAYLVASRAHPLVMGGKVNLKQLRNHPILTVRGSSPRLNMSTGVLEADSRIQFNDFHSKKIALLSGLGFGWMPEYLIRGELRGGKLKIIEWEKSNKHVFHPHLYHRGDARLGKAAQQLIEYLSKLKRV